MDLWVLTLCVCVFLCVHVFNSSMVPRKNKLSVRFLINTVLASNAGECHSKIVLKATFNQ